MSTAISALTDNPHILPVIRDGKEVDLARSTVYLELYLGALGDKRKVPTSEIDVGEADKKLFRLSKQILESETLKRIHSFDRETRDLIALRCHPFKRSVYFLPMTLADVTRNDLVERRAERNQLIDRFLEEYPALCRNLTRRLTAKYYKVTDYPPVEEVATRFKMTWLLFSFGAPENLAVFNPDLVAEAREDLAAQVRQAAEHIEQMMRARALELVSHLRDRLQPGSDGRKKQLHDSALTNLAEYLAYFDHKNSTNDTDLKSVVENLRAKLSNTDVEAIKNSDALRQRLHQEMSTITEQLESMIQRVPKRQITLH